MQTQTEWLYVQPLNINGEEIPSRIGSWIFWRDIFQGKVDLYRQMAARMKAAGYVFPGNQHTFLTAAKLIYHENVCPFCQSSGERWDNHGMYYCMCRLLTMRSELYQQAQIFGSTWGKATMDDYVPYGSSTEEVSSQKDFKNAFDNFLEYPTKHMVLSGPTGVGKTKALLTFVNRWFPWALYLTANDFEGKLRGGLDKEGNPIGSLMDALTTWPILAIDDLGIEYNSKWISQKSEDLIEKRTRAGTWTDHITIVATNISGGDFRNHFSRDGVSRIGSRLTDRETVLWVTVKGLDHRNKKK